MSQTAARWMLPLLMLLPRASCSPTLKREPLPGIFTSRVQAQGSDAEDKQYFDVLREKYPLGPRLKRLVRRELTFPPVSGYQIVTGDFHIHTLFSDGSVMPAERVCEAWRDGLDVLAITDHSEYLKTAFPNDTGRAYGQVRELANALNLILVRAAEVSTVYSSPGEKMADVLRRRNADFIVLFVKDESQLFAPFDVAMRRAREQGCINIWAHPGRDWHPVAQRFLEAGWLHGIELRNTVNSGGDASDEVETRFLFNGARDWAKAKGLAMFASSDYHSTGVHDREPGQGRDYTLLLVKERSLEGVREAIISRRTMVWFQDSLWGDPENLSSFAQASLRVEAMHVGARFAGVRVRNLSSFPFEVRFMQEGGPWRFSRRSSILPAMSTSVFPGSVRGSAEELRLRLNNVFIDSRTKLDLTLPLRTDISVPARVGADASAK